MSHTYCNPGSSKLLPPFVPQASRHGIGVRIASHLMVHIHPYSDMDEGDLIELFWDGCYVASKILTVSDIDQDIALRVPESFLQNGKARAYYKMMKVGGAPSTSPTLKIWVKLDAPGGQLLDPIEEENQGLAPLSLPPSVADRGLSTRHMNSGLPITIEPYLNMAPHDEITLRWGDLRMDLPPLTLEDVGEPIDLVVPATLIREAGCEQLEATYCVIDRVGNNSLWAPPRKIKIRTSGELIRCP